jgi:hypothetical protein
MAVIILAGDLAMILASVGPTYRWVDCVGEGSFRPKLVALAAGIYGSSISGDTCCSAI